MFEAFRDGGFGMFPTLAFGIALCAIAIRYATKPEKRFVPLLLALGTCTLSSGALGFVSGFIVATRYVDKLGVQEHASLAIVGAGEALNCVALALVMVTLAALATVVGAARISRQTAP
jgi:hypothetical protein